MLSAPKTPKATLRECPGYDYYAPEAIHPASKTAAPKPHSVLTPLEQMYGYYEAA